MSVKPSGSAAVMANKRPRLSAGLPWQDAELFPTPPWATRALIKHVLPPFDRQVKIWEPCAGLGHMAAVLAETSSAVFASDKFHYTDEPLDKFHVVPGVDFTNPEHCVRVVKAQRRAPDWIITNPPFSLAEPMLVNALSLARCGVAFLLRLQWLETQGRFNRIFSTPRAPTKVAIFAERVPMCEGGWDPRASTATAYAWFVWMKDPEGRLIHEADWSRGDFNGQLIPATCKAQLSQPADRDMARWHVPGFVPPSTLKKSGKNQQRMEL